MTNNKLLDDIQAFHSQKQTAKQKRIIDAAITLFAEKGYSNTSTAEIAKLAEVSEASIFKRYGTKDKFLLALIVPFLKEMFPVFAEETLDQLMTGEDSTFEELLRSFIINRIEFAYQNREILQVIVKEIIYQEELKNEMIPVMFNLVSTRFTPFVTLAQERGELREQPTAWILKMIFTFFSGFFVSRFAVLHVQTISDEEIEDVVQFIMSGIKRIDE